LTHRHGCALGLVPRERRRREAASPPTGQARTGKRQRSTESILRSYRNRQGSRSSLGHSESARRKRKSIVGSGRRCGGGRRDGHRHSCRGRSLVSRVSTIGCGQRVSSYAQCTEGKYSLPLQKCSGSDRGAAVIKGHGSGGRSRLDRSRESDRLPGDSG